MATGRSLTAAVVAGIAIAVTVSTQAHAGPPAPGGPISVGGGRGDIDTSITVPGRPDGRGGGSGGAVGGSPAGSTGGAGVDDGSGPPPCSYSAVTPEQALAQGLGQVQADGETNVATTGGQYYVRRCPPGGSSVVWVPDGAPAAPGAGPAAGVVVMTPAMLALEARNQLQLPEPQVGVSPDDAGNPSLVNLPTWWWVSNGEPLTQRTQAGPVWAEVTATPYATSWAGGDGGRQDCPGLGFPFERWMSETQAGSCRYTYLSASEAFDAQITVVWQVTWVGSGGTGGELDPMTMQTLRTLPVYERHAIVTGGQGL